MATDKAITNALLEAVRDTYAEDIDKLSVNYVRRIVEEKLGLEEGTLKQDEWKGKSKEAITMEVARLDEQGPPQSSPAPQPKAKAKPKAKPAPAPKVTKKPEPPKKRAAPVKAEPRKRQKKEATPSSEDEELSELESAEETPSESEAPRGKKRAPARGGKKGAKKGPKDESQSEEESELSSAEDTASEVESEVSDAPKAKKPANAKPVEKQAPKRAAAGSRKSTERVDSEDEGEDAVAPAKAKPATTTKAKSESANLSDVEDAGKESKPAAAEDSESDLSVLLDEPPKRKSKPKTSKPATSKPSKPTTALDPAAAELKTLQSQLLKCGIRKIWQFELKEYGDDTKAKIAHLKRMLRDVGMHGRFSEARAKEIKEMRELEQDLEFVKEGARLWGKTGRRSDAAKANVGKKWDEDEEEEGGEGDGESEEAEEEEVPPTARRAARAKADLAFLGEESDSDSD